MGSDTDDIDEDGTSSGDVEEITEQARTSSRSAASKEAYIRSYMAYRNWLGKNDYTNTCESAVFGYFADLSKNCRPKSLWSTYSKLKSNLSVNENIDITTYKTVIKFLKNKSKGFDDKKDNVFTQHQVLEFLHRAPDESYLSDKVVLIFGISGALRCQELVNVDVMHVQEQGQTFLVSVIDTKTKQPKTFIINPEYSPIVHKYISLRPDNTPTNRFFLGIRNNQCTRMVIGKNTFAKVPQRIAKYLQLPNPNSYTGHALRRTGLAVSFMQGYMSNWKWGSNVDACLEYAAQETERTRRNEPAEYSSVNMQPNYNHHPINNFRMEECDMQPNYNNIRMDECEDDVAADPMGLLQVMVKQEFNQPEEELSADSTMNEYYQMEAYHPPSDYKLGKLIIEGKTKKVFEYPADPKLCYLESKDRITAGDGAKSHELQGKAAISNTTNAKVFELLNAAGIKTAFVKLAGEKAFFSKKCEMVPIEWITRRLATGSFLKRNPGVPEGFRFKPPLQETCFKDDENHDPIWSEAQIVSAGFKLHGVTIGKLEYDIMKRTALVVFEVLERFWATKNCALIDMKIEFGVDVDGEILVADIIDSDSWRLWPSGDKRLMKDKQVYRNLSTVTQADLETVKSNFKWIADQIKDTVPPPTGLVVIFMGSKSDEEHCNKIAKHAQALGLRTEIRVSSAHKGTEETLRILSDYEDKEPDVVLVAVAGRSNGLGPVLSGNTSFPVINCPPGTKEEINRNVWSSLDVPSGLGCTTVLYPETAAIAAANHFAAHDHFVWSKLRVKRLNTFVALQRDDAKTKNA